MNIEHQPINLVKDALPNHWVYHYLPSYFIPYAQLARWDRPVGWQLLLAPCLCSLALAFAAKFSVSYTDMMLFFSYSILFCFGAIAMRGAACTLNDIVDIEIDRMVERTKLRPLASGTVTKAKAWLFMLTQCLVGLLILLCFNKLTIIVAMCSIILCVIYPFMKRLTHWPQFFLGLAFAWGSFLGWTSLLAKLAWPPILLYVACIFWIIGYDTIYACQDVKDDLKLGIGSTALKFQANIKLAVGIFYSLFAILLAAAFYMAAVPRFAYLGLMMVIGQLAWQIYKLDGNNATRCLYLFKSNAYIGFILYIFLFLSALRI